jgi:multicomponent Na+:H+ antiporter subunit G
MMETVITVLSWFCLVTGSAFAIIGGIGLLRLPDFYARMHGGGITDTLGAGLILIGLSLQSGLSLVTVKLLLILAFSLVASPTSGYALAKSARTHGLEPWVKKEGDR